MQSQNLLSRPGIASPRRRSLAVLHRGLANTKVRSSLTTKIICGTQYLETLTVPVDSRDCLFSAMKNLPSPYTAFESHCNASATAISNLPAAIITAIQRFQSQVDAPGAVHLRGLPTDENLPETPANGKRSKVKVSFVSEGCLTG